MVQDRGTGASTGAWGCPTADERNGVGSWPLRRCLPLWLQLQLCSPSADPAGLAGAPQGLSLPQAGCVVKGQRKPLVLQQQRAPWGQGPPKAPRVEPGAQGVTQHPVPRERGRSLAPAPQHGAMQRLARKSPAALPLHREN